MDSPTAEATHLLRAWSGGDRAALERLMPLVYQELRRMARRYMQREQQGNTLQATALVNEAYLRLVDVSGVSWQDRAHFFAISAHIMRRILTTLVPRQVRCRGCCSRAESCVHISASAT